jgi:nicotinamide mononucleotide adenylyltransferase
MARVIIKQMARVEKIRNSVHESVVASYDVFTFNGVKYIQIDTFGRNDREYTEKVSQIIQLDETSVRDLISLLSKHFDR